MSGCPAVVYCALAHTQPSPCYPPVAWQNVNDDDAGRVQARGLAMVMKPKQMMPKRMAPTTKPTPDPNCAFSFSAKGDQALRCMEWHITGCYLDSECYWTLFIGHLVEKSASEATYKKCCDLLNSGKTAEQFYAEDKADKSAAVIRNLNKNPKFCNGGAQALTQGQFDALVTATFQGAVKYEWYKLDKDDLLQNVREKTKKKGGVQRLDLFNTLWNDQPLSCKEETFEPSKPYLQAQCKTCTSKTADKADDKLCEAAAEKKCCPPTDLATKWSYECCEGEFQCSNPKTCGEFSNCGCSTTTEGEKYCWNNELCSTLVACSKTAQCPTGTKCVKNTCCGAGGVCLRPCTGLASDGSGIGAEECAGTAWGCSA